MNSTSKQTLKVKRKVMKISVRACDIYDEPLERASLKTRNKSRNGQKSHCSHYANFN